MTNHSGYSTDSLSSREVDWIGCFKVLVTDSQEPDPEHQASLGLVEDADN
jgi:hypothetical protein